MELHLIIHSCLTPGKNCWDGATTEANGYWVNFSFPGAIMQKENMAHRENAVALCHAKWKACLILALNVLIAIL